MMKIRFLPVLALVTALLAACGSAPTATNPPPATQPPTAVVPTMTLAAPTLAPATESVPNEEPTAVPVATSRGPDLHATDPTTVSLASGGLQFVEFFRFT